MNYTKTEKQKFKEINTLINIELNKLNIPKSDFYDVCSLVLSFNDKHKQLRQENYTAFYMLTLTAAYNAGKKR